MSIWQKVGGTLGKIWDVTGQLHEKVYGRKFLPEMGLTESLESWGGAPSGSPFVWVKPVYAAEPQPSSTPERKWGTSLAGAQAQVEYAKKMQSSGGGGGSQPPSGGGGGGSRGKRSYSIRDIEEAKAHGWTGAEGDIGEWWARKQAEMASAEEERRRAEEAFAPIFSELDRQIGLLPQQRKEYEQQIENLYGTQIAEAEAAKKRELGALETAKTEEMERSKQSLRDLAENVRDLLSAAANVWGGSSAIPAVTGGIARRTSKERGRLLRERNAALAEIGRKHAEVENLYNVQAQKIDAWRANKLLEVAQQIREMERAIRGQKAEIQANMRLDALNWARQRLAQIDAENRAYKRAIDSWKMQRQAELEDWLTKLKATAAYESGNIYSFTLPPLGQPGAIGGMPVGGYMATRPKRWNPLTGRWEYLPEEEY